MKAVEYVSAGVSKMGVLINIYDCQPIGVYIRTILNFESSI